MLIKVKVFPESKKNSLKKKGIDSFEVQVKEKAKKGKANKAVTEILSDYFNVPKEKIRLIRGGKSHHKIFEIKDE